MPHSIDYISDLHVKHWGDRGLPRIKIPISADALFLAGDLDMRQPQQEIRHMFPQYRDVVSVRGNHDFYGTEGMGAQNVYSGVLKNGLTWVASTLWSDFRGNIPCRYETRRLNDFRQIGRFRAGGAEEMIRVYNLCREGLLDHAGADIVMTHFPPIVQSTHPDYENDELNPYFINDDPGLFEAMAAKVWIHGHTHSQFDYVHDGTRVVCNPVGYPGEMGKPRIKRTTVNA